MNINKIRRAVSHSATISSSGLFDIDWFTSRGGNRFWPALDYCLKGVNGDTSCCYLFDEKWYLEQYPDVRRKGILPLVHYIECGEQEGRSPSPLFDVRHYRNQLGHAQVSGLLLAHYLNVGWTQGLNPNRYFETRGYLDRNTDLQKARLDPFKHYLFTGYREGRIPSSQYSFEVYAARYGISTRSAYSPLAHFLYNNEGNDGLLRDSGPSPTLVGPSPTLVGPSPTLIDELKHFQSRGDGYEKPQLDLITKAERRASVIAFYLPQFHPIPENDRWWGQGFTEWSNTARGVPRFVGHQQPHLPGDLGYYDLRQDEVMSKQVELAQQAGIEGFCFYYYNFNATRLLEKPLNRFLERKELGIDFCLMWANENWTRRWDGLDSEILIAQDYLKDNDAALIDDIGRHFADSRYIRINGRPVFFIYRPGIIPNAKERISRWRKLFKQRCGEKPLLFMAQGFGDHDPAVYGLDGAVEFPPHKLAVDLPPVNNSLQILDPDFSGTYFAYDDLIASSLKVEAPEFPLIRTAVPAWDNEARRPGKGMGFVGSTPAKYEHWLSGLIDYAAKNPVGDNKPLVFVNAWNEWAEGTHLEPDHYWGHAYLNATKRAITGRADASDISILYIGHDAHQHGAQLLSLNIVKTLVRTFGIRVEVILPEGGALESAFREIAPTHVVGGSMDTFRDVAQDIKRRTGAQYAICNTVVTGLYCKELGKLGIRAISLIHELPTLIAERGFEDRAEAVSGHAHKIVFAAPFVRSSFESIVGDLGDRAVIRPQGIYQNLAADAADVEIFRQKLGIPKKAKVVVNVGFGDLRKGFDLFVRVAQIMARENDDYYFLWLGNVEKPLALWMQKEVESLGKRFIQLPYSSEGVEARVLANASVFCLTSREDPFPSVVMESLALGVPVVGFEGAGGFVDLLQDPANGTLVRYGDIDAMVSAVRELAGRDTPASRKTRAVQTISRFDWNDYVFFLVELLCPTLKRVSVVVPNYNCAPYIEQRLMSIFRQRYPAYEIILLDDASTDTSLASAREIAAGIQRTIKVICNETNSGGAFPQWIRGAEAAKGEYLWIAEADDAAEPAFLSALLARMDEGVALAYCDSKQVDETGKHLADDYQYHYRTVEDGLFSDDFRLKGKDFVARCLSVKNLIMNVSSVLVRKDDFLKTVAQCRDAMLEMRVAGDWYFYVSLLTADDRDIVFLRDPLNVHRRHQSSVTSSVVKEQHFEEVVTVQRHARRAVSLGPKEKSKVAHYKDELARQFGLNR